MKKILMVLFSLIAILSLQNIQPLSAQTKLLLDTAIYRTVEHMPQFPGGMEALQKYFRENVHYPQSAIDSNVQGRVMVEFVIAQTGDITRVSVTKSVDPTLDSEAVRVVSAMPKWEPGVQKGQKVNVYYKVPITFKLEEESTDDTVSLYKASDTASVKKMPSFPGGMSRLKRYLSENIKYPAEAIEIGASGIILVEFVVDADGSIADVHALNNPDIYLTKEAVRVVKEMPKWIPGETYNGKKIRVRYKVPVTFRLK